MDAAEADFDAKLYKASGDIIPELQAKLPLLIWHDVSCKKLRTHVLFTKCEELKLLVSLLARFNSTLTWPGSWTAFKNGLNCSTPSSLA